MLVLNDNRPAAPLVPLTEPNPVKTGRNIKRQGNFVGFCTFELKLPNALSTHAEQFDLDFICTYLLRLDIQRLPSTSRIGKTEKGKDSI